MSRAGLLMAASLLLGTVSPEALGAGFVENVGQVEAGVGFFGTVGDGVVYFTARGPVLQLRRVVEGPAWPRRERERRDPRASEGYAVLLRPVAAQPAPRLEGLDPSGALRHYLPVDDPEQRAGTARVFSEVVYRDVWPGIDLVYAGSEAGLTYRVVLGPGADPSVVRFDYEGAVTVDRSAAAVLAHTPLGSIRDRRPDGLRPWGELSMELQRAPAPEAGAALEVQAVSGLRWGSLLGGSVDDAVYSVVLDESMRPIVTGVTRSVAFPTSVGALEPLYSGGGDAFVAQFDADGRTLLWSTFLGGSGDDRGWVVRRDSLGRIVVGGITNSPLFPLTAGAYDVTPNGGYDGFVAKLAADGTALVWSTLFGGSDREWNLSGLELDAADGVVFCGSTRSADLPTTPGALQGSHAGGSDGFVARLSADGSSLVWATYMGGEQSDAAEELALDAEGRPVVVGWTYSTDFPVTDGALRGELVGPEPDAFVGRLAGDGGSLVFSTLLGGADRDEAFGVALVEPQGILITGRTDSNDFPATPGAFDSSFSGSFDAFVASLAPDGASLNWATYLGGAGGATALDIVPDPWRQPVVAGWTCGDFPTAGTTYDDSFNGVCDGFVARLSDDGSGLLYGSYVGGWRDDGVYALALDGASHPVLGGESFSSDFPSTPEAFDPTHNSPDAWYDGFVVSLLTPAYCTDVDGDRLTIAPAVRGACPAGSPQGALTDLIEGRLEQLNANDIGNVRVVACDSAAVTFGTDTTPAAGLAFFQLARSGPDGNYGDGAGPALVGNRSPTDGDCP